jgi:hypothetical protein
VVAEITEILQVLPELLGVRAAAADFREPVEQYQLEEQALRVEETPEEQVSVAGMATFKAVVVAVQVEPDLMGDLAEQTVPVVAAQVHHQLSLEQLHFTQAVVEAVLEAQLLLAAWVVVAVD